MLQHTYDVNVGQGVTFTQTGNATFTGIVTATSFVGSGANLTSLPAGQLTGTVADARISTLTASKLTGALPMIDGSNLTGVSGVTINNNADNRVITGSGSANTLEGESQLLFTGTNLGLEIEHQVLMKDFMFIFKWSSKFCMLKVQLMDK